MTTAERLAAIQADWNGCTRCFLCKTRTQVVHLRGRAPDADFVFIGEGPGTVEDAKGRPFVGPAGGMLEQMISVAFEKAVPIGWRFDNDGWQLPLLPNPLPKKYDPLKFQDPEVVKRRKTDWPSTAFMNLVGCIPIKGGTISIPAKESIDACRPRTSELLAIVNPRTIVRCGSQATVHLPDRIVQDLPRLERIVDTIHPAAILRQSDKNKTYKATVNQLLLAAVDLGFPF